MSDDSLFIEPEFQLPFTFTDDGSCLLLESGSDAEIQQCAWAVLSYQPGQFLANPSLGAPEQVFQKGGVNTNALENVLALWEPRADELISVDPNWAETLIQAVTIRLNPNRQA